MSLNAHALNAACNAYENVMGSPASVLALRRAIRAYPATLSVADIGAPKPVTWQRIDDDRQPRMAVHARELLRSQIEKFGEQVVVSLLMVAAKAFPRDGGLAGDTWAHAEWAKTMLARVDQITNDIGALTEENATLRRALAVHEE